MGKNIGEKECPICKNTFSYNHYKIPKCCSEECAQVSRTLTKTKLKEKICDVCGKSFKTNRKYCSKECHIKFQLSDKNPIRSRIEVDCLHCGKTFTKQSSSKKMCCSISCGTIHANKIKFKNFEHNIVTNVCEMCDKEYDVWNYRKDSRFCSRECHHNSKPRIELICEICGISFSIQNHRKSARCCSKECAKLLPRVDFFNYSKAEKELVLFLKDSGIDVVTDLYIKYNHTFFIPDIVVGNKIIEYYGDYWHCNPEKYQEDFYNKNIAMTAQEKWSFDYERIKYLEEQGFSILIIWESDYNKSKEFIQNKCINFIKGEING